MSKHTPGPWRSNEDEPDGYKFIISEQSNGLTNDGYVICEVFGYTDETIANINLIKAAPELLTALENLVRNGSKQGWNDSYAYDMDNARAALAKAKGEV